MSVRFNSPTGGNVPRQGETKRRSPDEPRDGGRTRNNEPGGKTRGNERANGNQKPGGSVTITLELTSDDIGFDEEKPRHKGAGNGGGGGGGKEAVGQETGTNSLLDFLKKLFGGKEAQQAPQEQQAPAGQEQAEPQGLSAILQKIMAMLTEIMQKLGSQGEGSDGTAMQPEVPQQQAPQQQAPAQQQAPVQQPPAAPPAPPTKGEKDLTSVPTGNTGRPPGDNRSAEEIINDNPALKNLGNQKDIKREELKKQCGDWTEANPDPKSRADAAYNMAKVLNWIDSSKNREGGDRGPGDGDIQGITKDGDARHGTEAGNLKDFAEKGYGALKADHKLDQTKDTHVKLDGSNKDNFQWFAGEVGKKLWFIPGLSNVLTGIGNSEGGFLGALKGAAGGVLQTWKGAAEGLMDAVKKGRINPAMLLAEMYKGALSETTAAPQEVKDVAKML